jgi:hypothetical protein
LVRFNSVIAWLEGLVPNFECMLYTTGKEFLLV